MKTFELCKQFHFDNQASAYGNDGERKYTYTKNIYIFGVSGGQVNVAFYARVIVTNNKR